MSAVLWPFPVNWRTPLTETLQFRTEILTSRSGNEQRRALQTTARRSFEFSTLLAKQDLLKFHRLMAAAHNQDMLLPDFTARLNTVAPVPAGAVVVVDGVAEWLFAGQTVVLAAPGGFLSRTILSVVGTTVTFTAPIADVPARTGIHPALSGLLAADISAAYSTNDVASVSVRFAVDPGTTIPRAYGYPVAFNGLEVVDWTPNWATGTRSEFIYPRETLDYGRGRIMTYRPITFPSVTRHGSFLAASPAQIAAIKGRFEAAKGRRGEFYLPTGQADMHLIEPILSGSASMRVAGGDIPVDTVHQNLMIRLRSGEVLFRAVASVLPSTADTLVQLAAPVPYQVNAADVRSISWMPRHRFASDSLTIEWVTSEVARCSIGFTSLENKAGL